MLAFQKRIGTNIYIETLSQVELNGVYCHLDFTFLLNECCCFCLKEDGRNAEEDDDGDFSDASMDENPKSKNRVGKVL